MMRQQGLSGTRIAALLGHPRSTVYSWLQAPPQEVAWRSIMEPEPDPEADLKAKIREICGQEEFQTYGYRRVRAVLKARYGLGVNRKKVQRLMRELGLAQNRAVHKATRGKVLPAQEAHKPNERWEMDMTRVMLEGMIPAWLIVVIDCFTREIVGWELSLRCRAKEWLAALDSALNSRFPSGVRGAGLILRTDNGCQPTSKLFGKAMEGLGLVAEFTGYNCPKQNAYVERVIRTLKEEEIWLNGYATIEEARERIGRYIAFYNRERVHSSLGYVSPLQFCQDYFRLNKEVA